VSENIREVMMKVAERIERGEEATPDEISAVCIGCRGGWAIEIKDKFILSMCPCVEGINICIFTNVGDNKYKFSAGRLIEADEFICMIKSIVNIHEALKLRASRAQVNKRVNNIDSFYHI